jgi:hypothetical protein
MNGIERTFRYTYIIFQIRPTFRANRCEKEKGISTNKKRGTWWKDEKEKHVGEMEKDNMISEKGVIFPPKEACLSAIRLYTSINSLKQACTGY